MNRANALCQEQEIPIKPIIGFNMNATCRIGYRRRLPNKWGNPMASGSMSRRAGWLAVLAVACAWLPASGAWAADGAGTAVRLGSAPTLRLDGNAFVAAVDPLTDTGYLAEWSGDSGIVQVIDLATGQVQAAIPVGSRPDGIGVDPATGMIYVGCGGTATVAVIDGATNTVIQTISGGTSWAPDGSDSVAVDPVTDTVYVSADRTGTTSAVEVIDGATGTVTATIPGPGYGTNGVAVNPDTDTVYAAYSDTPSMQNVAQIISAATDSVTGTIAIHEPALSIAADPVTDTFVLEDGGLLYFYDGVTGALAGSISNLDPNQITIDNTTGTVLAATQAGVALINPADRKVAGIAPADFDWAIAVDPPTGTVLVALGYGAELITLHAPGIGGPAVATLRTGRQTSIVIRRTGTPSPAFAASGRLPRGISLGIKGILSGTPQRGSGGVYHFLISASNGVPPVASERFVLTIDQPPAFTTPRHLTIRAGSHHVVMIRATGFPSPVLTEKGKLPAGLRFTAHANGIATISGTPARKNRGRSFAIRLVASNGIGQPVTQVLDLHIQ
jgi:YVTN family beta-propeller protein